MHRLPKEFQTFWRDNSDIWQERFDYKEAAPNLILQAFLQRVINGGGRIIREMAGDRKRLDLCVKYDGQRYPIELKLRCDPQVEDEGKTQIAEYMDTLGCREGWLLLGRRVTASPGKRNSSGAQRSTRAKPFTSSDVDAPQDRMILTRLNSLCDRKCVQRLRCTPG